MSSSKPHLLIVSAEDHFALRGIVASLRPPDWLKLRARILLAAAQGFSNPQIAAQLSVSRPTVMKWRAHYSKNGLVGLNVGRTARAYRARLKENQIVNRTYASMEEVERFGVHGNRRWKISTLAKHLGVSKNTVQRVWKEYGIKPRPQRQRGWIDPKTFLIHPDPDFGLRIVGIIDLYYDRRHCLLVLSAAREGEAVPEMANSDDPNDCRHSIDAELDDLLGGLTAVKSRAPRNPGNLPRLLNFLSKLVQEVAPELDIHLLFDSLGGEYHSTYNNEKFISLLNANPRIVLHVNSYITWLQLVERWFKVIKASDKNPPVTGARELASQVRASLAASIPMGERSELILRPDGTPWIIPIERAALKKRDRQQRDG
jgi:transposase